MKKIYKNLMVVAILYVSVLSIAIVYSMPNHSTEKILYKSPEQIKKLTDNSPLGDIQYISGKITNIAIKGGAGRITLNNTLTLALAMSTDNSDSIMKGKVETLYAKITKICNDTCDQKWDITEIMEETKT